MFLLDIDVLSEMRKAGGGRANPNVVAWLSGQDASAFYVSAIALMEPELRTLLIKRRDPAQ